MSSITTVEPRIRRLAGKHGSDFEGYTIQINPRGNPVMIRGVSKIDDQQDGSKETIRHPDRPATRFANIDAVAKDGPIASRQALQDAMIHLDPEDLEELAGDDQNGSRPGGMWRTLACKVLGRKV